MDQTSSFCSFLTENIKPIEIPLPITKEDLREFSIASVDRRRTYKTLKSVYELQNSFSKSVIPHVIVHLIVGLVLIYAGGLALVLSLFNLILFLIIIGMLMKFVRWSRRNIRSKQ